MCTVFRVANLPRKNVTMGVCLHDARLLDEPITAVGVSRKVFLAGCINIVLTRPKGGTGDGVARVHSVVAGEERALVALLLVLEDDAAGEYCAKELTVSHCHSLLLVDDGGGVGLAGA